MEIPDTDKYCQQYILSKYLDMPDKVWTRMDANGEVSTGGDWLAYGDILYPALMEIRRNVSFEGIDSLIELGSGIGRTCLYFALRTPVRKITGYEINPYRHAFSKQVLESVESEMKDYLQDKSKEISFILEDFNELEELDADMIFMDSTVFTRPMMRTISSKINASARVKSIVSFKRVPSIPGFYHERSFASECSWGTGACNVYKRK